MDLIRILSICKILLVLNRSIIDISISENNIKVDFPCYSNFLKLIYSKELPHSSTKSCQVGQEELSPWPEQSLKNKTFKDLQGHSNFKSYRSEDGDEKTFIQHFRISFKNIYHTKFYYDSFGSTNGFIEKKIKTSKYQRNQDGHGPSDLIISEQLSSINIGNLIPELSDLFRCIVFVFLALTTSYLFKRYFLKHVNVDNVDTIDSELSEKESSIRTLNKCRHDTVNSEVNPVPFVETESETLVNEDDSPTIDLSSEEKNRLEIKNPEKHDTGELIHDRREPYVVKNDCLDSVRISEIRDIDAMVQNKCEKFPIENVCLVNNHALTTLSFFTKHDEAHSNDRSQGSTELLNETENRNVVDVPSEENVHNEENGLLNRTTDKCTTDTISCLISSKQEKRKLDKNDFFENECHCEIKSEGVQIPKSELFYATDGKDYDSELKKKADFNAMPVDVTDKECILKHKHNCDEVTLKTKKQIVDVDSSERSVDLSQIVVFLDFPSKTNLSYQNPFSKFPHAGKSYFKSPSTTIDLQQIKRSLFTCLLKKILLDTFKSMTSDLASNRTRIVDNVTTGSFSDHSLKIVLDLQTDGKDDDGDFSIDIKEFHSLKETRVNRDECLTQPYRSYLKLPRLSKRIVNNVEKRNMFDDIKSVCENILKSKDRNLPTLQEVEAMISKNKSRDLCLEDSFRKKHSEFHNHELGFDYSIARRWYRLPIIQKICQVNTLTINERIETFRFWPSDAAVSKIDLVEAGFIYKGDGYEVECDTCHLVKSDWSLDDEPLIIHKKLKPDCEFLKTTFPDLQVPINRNETDNAYQVEGHQSLVNQMDSMSIRNHASQNELNLPLNLPTNVKNEETQRNMGSQISFITAPQQQPLFDGAFTSMNPSTLFPPGATALPANDGLSIAGVPPRHPDFATIQQRIWTFRPWPYGHIQDPVYLVDAGFYYIGKEDIVRCYFCDIGLAEWDAEDDPWAEHARHSPECEYLKREKGLEFIENIQVSWRQIYCPRHPEYSDYHVRVETYTNWPSHLDQRPNALAEAGFYYTGEDDVVRCHYCDGGLRQWEPGDVPWTEHARWFPFCKYIVKIKGLAFVEDIARRYNLLTQSQAVDPETQMIDDAFSEGERYSNLPDAVYDRILELGYTCQQINRAFHYHVQMTGRRHASADELTNILLENDFSVRSPINNQPSAAAKQAAMKTPSDIENLEPEKLLDMNKQLRSQLICNICNKNESSIVFSPCGHRNTCENCSKDLSTCKTCGSRIDAKYKSYLA